MPDQNLVVVASHSGTRLAYGGVLQANSQEVIFVPNKLDRRFGGRDIILESAQIVQIGERSAELSPQNLLNGGLGRRLQIDTLDRGAFLFVVKGDLPDVISRLTELLQKPQ